jgi:hypothetical protein
VSLDKRNWPECPALGSDAAEVAALVAGMKLIHKLERDGHSAQCARVQVLTDGACCCAKDKP